MYREGTRRHSRDLTVIFYRQNDLYEQKRFSFAISKKYGCAVARNLCKRRLREILKEIIGGISPGDYLLIIKPSVSKLDYKSMRVLIQREVTAISDKHKKNENFAKSSIEINKNIPDNQAG